MKRKCLNLLYATIRSELVVGTRVDIVHYREKMNAFFKKRIDQVAVYIETVRKMKEALPLMAIGQDGKPKIPASGKVRN